VVNADKSLIPISASVRTQYACTVRTASPQSLFITYFYYALHFALSIDHIMDMIRSPYTTSHCIH